MVDFGGLLVKTPVAILSLFFIVFDITKIITYGGIFDTPFDPLIYYFYLELCIINLVQIVGDLIALVCMFKGGVGPGVAGFLAGSVGGDFWCLPNVLMLEYKVSGSFVGDKASEFALPLMGGKSTWLLWCYFIIAATGCCQKPINDDFQCTMVAFGVLGLGATGLCCLAVIVYIISWEFDAMTVAAGLQLLFNSARTCHTVCVHREKLQEASKMIPSGASVIGKGGN